MATPSPKSVVSPPVAAPVVPESQKITATVIMSEEDAYITERVASQPATLDEVRKVVVYTDSTKNRLSLPPYFERFSHDCTVGQECLVHAWKRDDATNRWSYGNKGEFIFRWVKKVKRAIDHAMNVQGWLFVNQRYFPDAPDHLFSANRGVELGDVVLFFLPAKQALALRAVPGRKSNEALKARLTTTRAGDVVMTGNLDNDKFYVPEGGGEEDESSAGVQEGRDF